MTDSLRPVYWVGSSKKDLLRMPDEVLDVFGFALHLAQSGKKHGASQAPKKSKHGIQTPKQAMDLIRERLKAAQEHAAGCKK